FVHVPGDFGDQPFLPRLPVELPLAERAKAGRDRQHDDDEEPEAPARRRRRRRRRRRGGGLGHCRRPSPAALRYWSAIIVALNGRSRATQRITVTGIQTMR